jgi:heptosyltransferase-1
LHTQSKFRLLVVRLGAMGDILHALPAATALRKTHPGWVIDWVVEPRWRALFTAIPVDESGPATEPQELSRAQPLVNRLFFASTRDWRHAPLRPQTRREVKTLRQLLRTSHYDAVLDLQGAVRSAVLARMADARRVIGEAAPREWAARWLFTERVRTRGAHVIEQDVEVAAAIAGDALEPTSPLLPIEPAAEAWADSIASVGADGRAMQPTVLINPGAGWGAKRWPVERYAAVAQQLIHRGLRVIVNAGPGEEEFANDIARATAGAAIAVTCTLEQLIALTRRVALAIAGDTGPLHLACALGRPVVGIYGPTDPSRNGPFGCPFRVLRSPQSRRDHARRDTPEAGLLTIEPADVLNAAEEMLAQEYAQ